jgi:agmatinase
MTALRALTSENNFLGLDECDSNGEDSHVIILSAPFEKTTTYGKGAAAGPEAVLNASRQIELYDCVTGCETFSRIGGIASLEPIICDDAQTLCDELEKETSRWLNKNRMVVTLGGEHTSVVGAVKAHANHYSELTILQLDAHSDLRNEYLGDSWNHACAIRRIMDFHTDIVQAAIRSQDMEERTYAEKQKIPVIYAHQIHNAERSGHDWIGDIIGACRRQVYVTFDCDAFDPSVILATGTPEPGGLSWNQVNRLFERLTAKRQLVGFDISELAPVTNIQHPQFTIAKLVYRILGFVSKTQRKSTAC